MFCSSCGTPRQGSSAYCVRCGARFQADAADAGSDLARRYPELIRHTDRGEVPSQDDRAAPRRSSRGPLTAVVAVLAIGAVAAGAMLLRAGHQNGAVSPAAATVQTGPAPSAAAPSPSARPSPAAASFADLYRQAGDGVVRIETTACGSGGVGSGFLIAPDLVATVAHVVDGAASIVLRQSNSTTTGTVVGFDRAGDLALVRASEPLTGHVFTMSATQPDVGTDVAAIGYPLAGAESLTKGAVSGLDRPVQTDTASLTGLMQTDTPLNPGNSGGPLLLADGTAVGIVDAKNTTGENIGYAIPTAAAATTLRSWQQAPTPVRFGPGCASPVGPSTVGNVVTDGSGSPDGPGLAQAFSSYTNGINHGDYAAAFAVLTPAAQGKTGYASFAGGTRSSYIVNLQIAQVHQVSAGRDSAEVVFTSLQDAAHGHNAQTCSEWQMTYALVQVEAGWRIDNATPHSGSPASC